MNLKSLFSSALGSRVSLPTPALVVPGVSLIGLGLLVWLARDFFVLVISGGLVLLGALFLVMAWRFRPRPGAPARIRVVESDDVS